MLFRYSINQNCRSSDRQTHHFLHEKRMHCTRRSHVSCDLNCARRCRCSRQQESLHGPPRRSSECRKNCHTLHVMLIIELNGFVGTGCRRRDANDIFLWKFTFLKYQ